MSKSVAHQSQQGAVAQADEFAGTMDFSSLRISAPESTGVLPRVTTNLRPHTEPAGVDVRMPARHQIIEELADKGRYFAIEIAPPTLILGA
jgi:hypothetical protein